jgi:predicted transcriptional regulator
VSGEEVTLRGFGELESKIMNILWSSGQPTTVREVLEELRRHRSIAYTTVMTVMDNLHRKQWLERERDGRAYRYRPVSSREHYVAELMRDALTSSTDQAATLVHFTEQLTDDESVALRVALRRIARRKS